MGIGVVVGEPVSVKHCVGNGVAQCLNGPNDALWCHGNLRSCLCAPDVLKLLGAEGVNCFGENLGRLLLCIMQFVHDAA